TSDIAPHRAFEADGKRRYPCRLPDQFMGMNCFWLTPLCRCVIVDSYSVGKNTDGDSAIPFITHHRNRGVFYDHSQRTNLRIFARPRLWQNETVTDGTIDQFIRKCLLQRTGDYITNLFPFKPIPLDRERFTIICFAYGWIYYQV